MTTPPRRRYRAPQQDGAALIDPPPSTFAGLLGQNITPAKGRYDCQGMSLADLASAARGALLQKAMSHTCEYRDVDFVPPLKHRTPFVLAGHQPELFHPGVWLKNFLLSRLAEENAAVAVNLIVDTDAARASAIRVPIGSTVEPVAYDAAADALPYEERRILDPEIFATFADRVRAASVHDRDRLLVQPLWEAALQAAARLEDRARLGRVLAEARHSLERQIGLKTLEVPLSGICKTPQFRWFTGHLLARLPHFWSVHNEALARYRAANHIRSRTHPVPNLAEEGEWLEAPFLLWTADNPRRRHLFVRLVSDGMEINDREGLSFTLNFSPDSPGEIAANRLQVLEARGIKLRPRALITTMYARLVLSDLFIHGIGGAKYDEVTDEIIRRFFGIEPPKYITATATFRLPIERPHVTAEDLRSSARLLRDVRYRPETLLSHPLVKSDAALGAQLEALAAEKREYLARHNPRRNAAEVFVGLDQINRAMHALLQPVEAELKAAHARLIDGARKSALLGSREFSFVLFSEELPARLLALCQGVA
jgi:hypothetical protein